jgi:type IV pilus assembly protein PilV
MIKPVPVHSAQERHPRRSQARGFTLVEVMVALIVIAIGTLGIAKMQALALSNTGASRTRALAAIEASSLAAAMHVNRAYWASYLSVPGTISVATTGTPPVTSTSATLQAALTAVATTLCPTGSTFNAKLSCYCASGNSAPCGTATYINMAASDLYDWTMGLASLLPAAQAQVACNNANSPVDCTITITWTENAVAINKQQSAAAAIQTVRYILYVIP